MKRTAIFSIAILMGVLSAYAFDFNRYPDIYINEHQYYITSDTTVGIVGGHHYGEAGTYFIEGDFIVPEKITHEGKTYTVTALLGLIGNISNIYMPNTIKTIDDEITIVDYEQDWQKDSHYYSKPFVVPASVDTLSCWSNKIETMFMMGQPPLLVDVDFGWRLKKVGVAPAFYEAYKTNAQWKDYPIVKLGDLNGDGEVNTSDITNAIDRIIAPSSNYNQICDINADGEQDVSDITTIINLIQQNK
ncbi:MAG: dockerin type I repeat-containing protein [Muribaculaceae bacterium]|nr:dockerin type I repeat-containing protein [Muribaculaceae bacterium]